MNRTDVVATIVCIINTALLAEYGAIELPISHRCNMLSIIIFVLLASSSGFSLRPSLLEKYFMVQYAISPQ